MVLDQGDVTGDPVRGPNRWRRLRLNVLATLRHHRVIKALRRGDPIVPAIGFSASVAIGSALVGALLVGGLIVALGH